MRVIVWHLAAAAAAFACVAVAACVGDDPSSSGSPAGDGGPAAGEFQGPCKNGLCLEGLSCIEGVCLHSSGSSSGSDAADDAPTDAGAGSDADAEASMDVCPVGDVEAGAAQNPCPTISSSSASSASSGAPPPPSPGSCAKGTACCIGAQSYNYCASSTTCTTAGGKPYGCSGTDTCAAGHVCCLVMEDAGANPKVTDNCPRTISKSGIDNTRCEQTACAATETRVCRDSSECTAPAQCRRVLFTTGDGTITLGVCL